MIACGVVTDIWEECFASSFYTSGSQTLLGGTLVSRKLGRGIRPPKSSNGGLFQILQNQNDVNGSNFLSIKYSHNLLYKLRKLHIEKLHDLYRLLDNNRMIKSRCMRREKHVARMKAIRSPYKILLGKPDGTKPLEKFRHEWKDNIQM
jgi:hypothetical protein